MRAAASNIATTPTSAPAATRRNIAARREFGAALPKLRRRVAADLKKRKLSRDAVLAAIVRLLDTQYLRVGNEQYAKDNKSFGATTLRSRHVKRDGGKMMMRFKGKHGIVREVPITDANLKRIVGRCHELPGQHLFQYVTEDGEPCPITSSDVNDYIREATGGEFTAKNFRTWGASVIAFDMLLEAEEHRKVSLKTVLEPVAEALGNTPAISRKSYVHPRLIDAAREQPRDPLNGMERPRARKWLSSAEVGLLDFLAGQEAAPGAGSQRALDSKRACRHDGQAMRGPAQRWDRLVGLARGQ